VKDSGAKEGRMGGSHVGREGKGRTFARLQDQHENILQQIRLHLTSKRNKISDLRDIPHGHLKNGCFIQLRKLLAEHQREEERVLIPIINKCLDSSTCENMRLDHSHMCDALARLERKRMQVSASLASLHRFFEAATEFEILVQKQFSREENVIYWFASLYLSHAE